MLLVAPNLPAAPAAADGDLHQRVFGRREARIQALEVVASIDGLSLDEVGVSVQGGQLLDVDSAALQSVLAAWLDPAGMDCLRDAGQQPAADSGRSAGTRRLRPDEALACGLTLSFDAAALQLQIELPLERRRERLLQLRPPAATGPLLQRQGWSAFLNLALGARQRDGQAGDGTLAFDGALGRAAATLEWEGGCVSSRCRVDSAALVLDQPARLRRWQLGDLRQARAGVLAMPNLIGLSVGTDFELDPGHRFTPQLQAPLELSRAGTLEVWQAGRLLQRQRLGPGRYRVEDFPLGFGYNEAVLRVTDDAGLSQTRSLQTYVDLALLDAGTQRWSAALGRPRLDLPQAQQRPWLLALEHARGWSAGTLQGALLSAPQLGFHALEVDWTQGLRRQLWQARLGCSQALAFGCRAALGWRQDADPAAPGWQQQAQLQWQSAQWQELIDAQPRGASLQAAWRAYRRLSGRWQLALAAQSRRASQQPLQHSLALQLSARLEAGWSVRLAVEHRPRSDALPGRELGVGLNLSWLFDRARQSLSLDYDGLEQSSSLGWQLSRGGQRGGWGLSADRNATPQTRAQGLAARWRGERLAAELGYLQTDAGGRSSRELALQARTALAYAEGALALSERINGGFAILRPAAADVGTVYVNPFGEDYLASDRGPGPAVVGNLRPYQPRELMVALPELPAGRDPGDLLPRLQVPYKGGLLAALGGARSVGLRARVLDDDGQPLERVAGTLTPADCAADCRRTLPVFVGREGRLSVLGLTAGDWVLQLASSPPRRHLISVPEAAEGIVDLGVLQP